MTVQNLISIVGKDWSEDGRNESGNESDREIFTIITLQLFYFSSLFIPFSLYPSNIRNYAKIARSIACFSYILDGIGTAKKCLNE